MHLVVTDTDDMGLQIAQSNVDLILVKKMEGFRFE